jgi:hypothetical protein
MPPMVDDGKLGITKCGRREKLIFMDCVNGIIKSNSSGEVILVSSGFEYNDNK